MNNLFALLLVLAVIGGYITHFITAFGNTMWVLFILGAIFFPVGVIHGWLVWLGVV